MAKKKVVKSSINDENEMYKFVKLIIIISALFLIFYLLTLIINNKKDSTDNSTATAEIQYDKILIGNMLTQSNDKYYVLVEDSNDNYINSYGTYLDMYKEKTEHLRVYYADLNNPLNTKFKAEEANTSVSDILNLRIKETTLFYIANGKIKKVYEGHDNINTFLSKLASSEESK